MSEKHHVIPQQRIKQARSAVAIKRKRFEELTEAEVRLLDTPLNVILDDTRNIVRISRTLHHRAHNGFERLEPKDLPRGIDDFAAEYALEGALEHELRLMGAE
jgi:hypothetical protein